MKVRKLSFQCGLYIIIVLILLIIPVAKAEEAILTYRGSQFTLPFTVTENPDHAIAAVFELQYDHTVLELIPNDEVKSDRFIISGDLWDIPVGQTINICFRSNKDCKCENYRISLKALEAYNIDEEPIDSLICSEGSISVSIIQAARDAANGFVPGFGITREQFEDHYSSLLSGYESWSEQFEKHFSDFPYQSFKDLPLYPSQDYTTADYANYTGEQSSRAPSMYYDLKTGTLIPESAPREADDIIIYGSSYIIIIHNGYRIEYYKKSSLDIGSEVEGLCFYMKFLYFDEYFVSQYDYDSKRSYPDFPLSLVKSDSYYLSEIIEY